MAFGTQMVIQNVQRTPLDKIIAEIFQKLKSSFSSESIFLIFQIEEAIQISMPAPTNEIIRKIDSDRFSEDKTIKLVKATIVSTRNAIKIIRRLFIKLVWIIPVKMAVNTGPGIIPPINPKMNAVNSSFNIH